MNLFKKAAVFTDIHFGLKSNSVTDLSKEHVVIVGMPLVDSLHAPLAAPAVLKASLAQAGIRSTALDLNIEVLIKVKSHPEYQNLLKFFKRQEVDDWNVQEISKILQYSAQRILDTNPTVIALSLLTFHCQNFTLWLSLLLRQLRPDVRIVMGGPGIKNQVANYHDKFRDTAIKLKLVDHYITGDGDLALIEYVKGNYEYPGINTDFWEPVKDLDSLPCPDWSDYNFYLYSQNYMPVVDAKGCVRNCEFCDIIEFWEKFQSRKAENVFKEILHQIEKYNMRNFDFRSSLSNGNLKEFRQLLSLMYEYNLTKKYQPEKISWNASFIVRQKSQHPEEMWKQMGETNATLSLGVESVVEKVRHRLGKPFDNQDIDWHLEMAKKYNVRIILMIITGYPTETKQDWEFTRQWFIDRAFHNKTISRLFLSPAQVLSGTGLERNFESLGMIPIETASKKSWETTDISYEERMEHHAQLMTLCKNLKFNLDAY
jgi:radical SAM superfamily enzyme YgiQ (UPF0313 family)